MNSLDLSFIAYRNARSRLDKAIENYTSLCQEEEKTTVILYNEAEPFASLNETIFWAMSIYDLIAGIKTNGYNEIKPLISSLRLIVNAMKHNKNVFDSNSFSSPGLHIAVGVEDGENAPVITDVQITPTILFAELKDINLDSQNVGQIKNYNNLIKGHSLSEIMKQLDSAIELLDSIRKSRSSSLIKYKKDGERYGRKQQP